MLDLAQSPRPGQYSLPLLTAWVFTCYSVCDPNHVSFLGFHHSASIIFFHTDLFALLHCCISLLLINHFMKNKTDLKDNATYIRQYIRILRIIFNFSLVLKPTIFILLINFSDINLSLQMDYTFKRYCLFIKLLKRIFTHNGRPEYIFLLQGEKKLYLYINRRENEAETIFLLRSS